MNYVHEEKTIAELLTVKVVDDMHPENPRDWDNAAMLVCWSRRYTLGDEQPSASPEEWLEDYKAANRDALIVPIYMYEHGGIALSTGGFSCPWDSGQVGYAVISAERILKEWPLSVIHPTPEAQRQAARACIDAEVKTYSAYLNGDVYGYIIENAEGDSLDSCSGFYGDTDEALKAGEEAAQALLEAEREAAQARAAAQQVRDAAPELLQALRDIANLNEPDLAKYCAKVDDIACATLARLGFTL